MRDIRRRECDAAVIRRRGWRASRTAIHRPKEREMRGNARRGRAVITVTKDVVVDRTPEAVYDFLADVRNEERWNPDVVRIESESDGPLAVGDAFEGVYRRGGRMRFPARRRRRTEHTRLRGRGQRA
jgi:hypothetical protein